jgi:hypothetical protein
VKTTNSDTEVWLSRHVITASQGETREQAWWESARPDSPLGILVSVESSCDGRSKDHPRPTELLIYASQANASLGRSSTPPLSQGEDGIGSVEDVPVFTVCALPLSSDLLHGAPESTPPPSPEGSEESEAVFLPLPPVQDEETVNEPTVRKRKSVTDAFDEATERRRKARRKGGAAVAAAAAPKKEDPLPALKHRRSISGSISQLPPIQSRPLSRSPSISSSRPPTARAPSEAPKRSALSRVESVARGPGESDEASTESKNKELISRLVMAGMRLYGLSQSKGRKSRADSSIASPAAEATFEQRDTELKSDEEYKLVYHQVFKGTSFAFRGQIASTSLQPHTEALRDAVDKLLALYCNDPLEAGLPSLADELTPGGRKAFSSATQAGSKEPHPFTSAQKDA